MATIKDIAIRAKVSSTLVSRVLNYDETLVVPDSTRKKIFEIAQELEYVNTRSKKSKKEYVIAIVRGYSEKEELEDTYYLSIRLSIEKFLNEENAEVFVLGKNESEDRLKGIDGIIGIGVFSAKEIEKLAAFNDNIVFADANAGESRDSVLFNMKEAVWKVLDYLRELGHERIGFIGGMDAPNSENTNQTHVDSRITYFKEYMTENGFFKEEYVRIGEFNPSSGHRLMKELMELEDRPTAIFAANDAIAIGAYHGVYEKGLRIPEDVSIIGFNDISTAKYIVPPLTTVRIHTDFLGETAAQMLMERIKGGRELSKVVITPTKLMIRASCAHCGQRD